MLVTRIGGQLPVRMKSLPFESFEKIRQMEANKELIEANIDALDKKIEEIKDEIKNSALNNTKRDLEKQIDELESQKKDLVKQMEELESKFQGEGLWMKREPWARGISSWEDFIDSWHSLGFITGHDEKGNPFYKKLRKKDENGNKEELLEPQMIEIGRGKYEHLSWGEYFHILVNIEDYPDFRPFAKKIAIDFLKAANFDADEDGLYKPFEYTIDGLDERLREVYDAYMEEINKPHPWDSGLISYPVVVARKNGKEIQQAKQFNVGRFSDRVPKEDIRQKSPYNLVDGAWLQNVLRQVLAMRFNRDYLKFGLMRREMVKQN